MPVIALYNLEDAGTSAADSATGNGAQLGSYTDGAASDGTRAVLDGVNDKVKIFSDPAFQLPRGTLEVQFAVSTLRDGDQTVVSRDSVGELPGGFRMVVTADGAISITHEGSGTAFNTGTGPGFVAPGDEFRVTYSWDEANGGSVQIQNLTLGSSIEAETPPGLTMDQGDINQPWMIGAGQSNSDPWLLNNLDDYMQGEVEYFQISDTVDNGGNDDPEPQPDTAATDEDTPVVIDVLENDSDPDGDALTIDGTPTATNGTVTVNPDGTITYTPNENFNGEDTITYTVRDPAGNTATSTVTVTVNPVNDAPVAVDDVAETPFETPIVIDVVGNDTDVDGDPLSVVGTPSSPDGTVTVNDDGTITFTPNEGFEGETTITYTVTDGNGGTDEGTVTVTVGEDPGPGPDGIVEGSVEGELIDESYDGDPNGDFVDNDDSILDPGPNDDRIYAYGGDDTVRAGEGDDLVFGGQGNDDVDGSDGDDTLNASGGDDTVTGGDGSDSVRGGTGNDRIDTRGGVPRPDIAYPGVYTADTDPNNDLDTVRGGLGDDTILTGDDRDVIYGGLDQDQIDAGVDDDLVYGGLGDDTVIGSEGRDTIYGKSDNDLLYGGLGTVGGDALDIPDADGDLVPDNNTDLIYGGLGNDTIFGRDDDDTIYGGMGDDVIDGGVDEDDLFGRRGNDTLRGGEGADNIFGGADRDVIIVDVRGDGINDQIDGNEGGDDFDTLDLRGSGPLSIVYSDDNPENGTVTFLDDDGNPTGTLDFVNIENVIPCFTPGTLIATPRGEIPVEELRAGDRVVTRDNGIQEIAWAGSKHLDWAALQANPHLKPVLIRKGSLGEGLPERDMVVSPNHRMLVANDRTALYFEDHEVLVAAKHLISGRGVMGVESSGVTYLHFMFERHEVVLADGAWTESFQPGDYTLKGMGNAQRQEIFELFPELKTAEGVADYQAARRTLKKHEAALLRV